MTITCPTTHVRACNLRRCAVEHARTCRLHASYVEPGIRSRVADNTLLLPDYYCTCAYHCAHLILPSYAARYRRDLLCFERPVACLGALVGLARLACRLPFDSITHTSYTLTIVRRFTHVLGPDRTTRYADVQDIVDSAASNTMWMPKLEALVRIKFPCLIRGPRARHLIPFHLSPISRILSSHAIHLRWHWRR